MLIKRYYEKSNNLDLSEIDVKVIESTISNKFKYIKYNAIMKKIDKKIYTFQIDINVKFSKIKMHISKIEDDYYVICILSFFYDDNKKYDIIGTPIFNGIRTNIYKGINFIIDGDDGLNEFVGKYFEYIETPIIDINKFIEFMEF